MVGAGRVLYIAGIAMPMRTHLMLLPLLALTLTLACAPAAGEPAPDDLHCAFLEQCTQEVLAALEQGAGLVLPEQVEVVLLTTAEATARRRAYAQSLGDKVGYTAAMDSMADLMFAGNLLGRYLPDERCVYVIEDVLFDRSGGSDDDAAEMLFPVLAHELVHAYDHQVYGAVPAPDDLEELLKDPGVLPEIQAQMSLLEGRATWASEQACEAAGRKPLPSRSIEQARDAKFMHDDGTLAGGALALVGNSVVRLKLVQYAYGRAFAKRVSEFGGEPFFAQVFAHLPLSMEELENFDLFLVRWSDEIEAAEDAASDPSAAAPQG